MSVSFGAMYVLMMQLKHKPSPKETIEEIEPISSDSVVHDSTTDSLPIDSTKNLDYIDTLSVSNDTLASTIIDTSIVQDTQLSKEQVKPEEISSKNIVQDSAESLNIVQETIAQSRQDTLAENVPLKITIDSVEFRQEVKIVHDSNIEVVQNKDTVIDNEDLSQEPKEDTIVHLAESYLGYITADAAEAIINIFNTQLEIIKDSIASWNAAHLSIEDRIQIVGIDRGYLYSVEHNRTFLPGIVIRLKNTADEVINEPLKIRVRYKRIATNEIWSIEETTIQFGSQKMLEKNEVIQRKLFSRKGVLSMRHIMPDLEAKVYINGRFFATYRVGEQEYLDWF